MVYFAIIGGDRPYYPPSETVWPPSHPPLHRLRLRSEAKYATLSPTFVGHREAWVGSLLPLGYIRCQERGLLEERNHGEYGEGPALV